MRYKIWNDRKRKGSVTLAGLLPICQNALVIWILKHKTWLATSSVKHPTILFQPHNMNDLDYEELTKDLIANFNTLADEVQLLSDRNTILQHKLSYAHSEVSKRCSFLFLPTPATPFMMRKLSSRSRAAQQWRPITITCILIFNLLWHIHFSAFCLFRLIKD